MPVQLGQPWSGSGSPGTGAVLAAGAVTLLKGPFLGPDLAAGAAPALRWDSSSREGFGCWCCPKKAFLYKNTARGRAGASLKPHNLLQAAFPS